MMNHDTAVCVARLATAALVNARDYAAQRAPDLAISDPKVNFSYFEKL